MITTTLHKKQKQNDTTQQQQEKHYIYELLTTKLNHHLPLHQGAVDDPMPIVTPIPVIPCRVHSTHIVAVATISIQTRRRACR